MKPSAVIALAALLLTTTARGQVTVPPAGTDIEDRLRLVSLARTDLPAFAAEIAGPGGTTFERAQSVVTWFAGNFDWTATDYRQRTLDEIFARAGGNCAELARVTTATLEALGLTMRKVREINLHEPSDERQATAARKVAEVGPRMSVFGRQHNDHVWIEIRDSESGEWFPADPSLGVIGADAWTRARYGFGARFTMDPTSAAMIAPFAVFAESADGPLAEDRTAHYAIEGFDRTYAGRLHDLPAWPLWKRGVETLAPRARAAFAGTENLHDSAADIASLVEAYGSLRAQYVERYGSPDPPSGGR